MDWPLTVTCPALTLETTYLCTAQILNASFFYFLGFFWGGNDFLTLIQTHFWLVLLLQAQLLWPSSTPAVKIITEVPISAHWGDLISSLVLTVPCNKYCFSNLRSWSLQKIVWSLAHSIPKMNFPCKLDYPGSTVFTLVSYPKQVLRNSTFYVYSWEGGRCAWISCSSHQEFYICYSATVSATLPLCRNHKRGFQVKERIDYSCCIWRKVLSFIRN